MGCFHRAAFPAGLLWRAYICVCLSVLHTETQKDFEPKIRECLGMVCTGENHSSPPWSLKGVL